MIDFLLSLRFHDELCVGLMYYSLTKSTVVLQLIVDKAIDNQAIMSTHSLLSLESDNVQNFESILFLFHVSIMIIFLSKSQDTFQTFMLYYNFLIFKTCWLNDTFNLKVVWQLCHKPWPIKHIVKCYTAFWLARV